MDGQLPYLIVTGPDGQTFEVELTKQRVTIGRLAWELRKKIEPDSKEPLFLETVRGLGYRLISRAA